MLRYLETFFRNRWLITIPAVLLLFTGSALVLTVPPEYGGMATVWAEKSTYLDLSNNDNQWVSAAELHSGRFRELAKTGTFSRTVVDRVPAMAGATEPQKVDLVYQIQNELQVRETGEHTVFVGFWHISPEVATAVVQLSIEEYSRVTALSATEQASQAITFYQERITAYENQILPSSTGAVLAYLQEHPEVRLTVKEGGQTDAQFALLKDQADRDREQYERYLRSLDEVMTESQAASRHQEVAFRSIDPPQLAPGGGKIGKKKLLLYAGVGTGLAVGYALLFVLLATELDRTLRHPRDVRRRLELQVLDVIPEYRPLNASLKRQQLLRTTELATGAIPSHSGS